MKKVRVGIFSFTCDEGCSIVFLEILNKKFFDWKKNIDFQNFRILQSKNEIKNLDIALVEGAISTSSDLKKLKEIRKNSKKLVAIGNCAINGMPSNLRNFFDKDTAKEIKPILDRFGHLKRVYSVKELVKTDDSIPGCPMDEYKFIEMMEKHLGGKKNNAS